LPGLYEAHTAILVVAQAKVRLYVIMLVILAVLIIILEIRDTKQITNTTGQAQTRLQVVMHGADKAK
jgi:hypothetical protein